jgi:hypothetical protein
MSDVETTVRHDLFVWDLNGNRVELGPCVVAELRQDNGLVHTYSVTLSSEYPEHVAAMAELAIEGVRRRAADAMVVVWVVAFEHDQYYDGVTTSIEAVFSDPVEAMVWADEERPPGKHRGKTWEWHWDESDECFACAVHIGSGDSSSWYVRPLELS